MEKANTGKTGAPKWGTKEWAAAYPWSKMDRKRRRRVLAVLPKELSDFITQDGGCVPFFYTIAREIGFSTKSAADKVAKLMNTIDAAAAKIVDFAVAAALESAWTGKTGKAK